jgi:hypothetical protein
MAGIVWTAVVVVGRPVVVMEVTRTLLLLARSLTKMGGTRAAMTARRSLF